MLLRHQVYERPDIAFLEDATDIVSWSPLHCLEPSLRSGIECNQRVRLLSSYPNAAWERGRIVVVDAVMW